MDAMSSTKLVGGNLPPKAKGTEDFGASGGGSTVNGMSHKQNFDGEHPEDMGMGTAGPNQLPIGPEEGSAGRGHRWG